MYCESACSHVTTHSRHYNDGDLLHHHHHHNHDCMAAAFSVGAFMRCSHLHETHNTHVT